MDCEPASADRRGLKAGDVTLGNLMISPFRNTIYGRPGRDQEIEKVRQSIEAAGAVGIPVVEYNFYAHRAMEGYYEETGRGGAGLTGADYDRMKDLPPLPDEGTHTLEEIPAWPTGMGPLTLPLRDNHHDFSEPGSRTQNCFNLRNRALRGMDAASVTYAGASSANIAGGGAVSEARATCQTGHVVSLGGAKTLTFSVAPILARVVIKIRCLNSCGRWLPVELRVDGAISTNLVFPPSEPANQPERGRLSSGTEGPGAPKG